MKRIIAFMLMLSLLISLPIITSAANKSADEAEIAAIDFLQALEVIKMWSADETVTRAEFVNAAVRCIIKNSGSISLGQTGGNAEVVFDDVAAELWAAYNIGVAKSLNIISGDGKNFYPNNPVTYENALKIAVSCAEYGSLAEKKGGYPSGYHAVANGLGITDDLSVTDANALTKGEAAVILRNLLFTPMPDTEIVSGAKHEINDDNETVLEYVFGIKNFTGIVVTNEYSSVDSDKTVKKGNVIIKDTSTGEKELFKVGETDASAYLGRRMRFFYTDDDDFTIVYFRPINKNGFYTVQGDEIVELDRKNRKLKIESEDVVDRWDTSTVKTSVEIPVTFNILKNGVFFADHSKALDILAGESEENIDFINFIDTDNDGTYDLMDMHVYVTYYVSHVADDASQFLISDELTGKKLRIDWDEDDKTELFRYQDGYSNDELIIDPGDVVSVFESDCKNKKYELYISEDSVSEKLQSADEKTVISENKEYDISNTVLKYWKDLSEPENEKYLTDFISVGKQYSLYLDFKGRAAALVRENDISDNYLFISKAGKSREKSIKGKAVVRACSLNGVMDYYDISDNVKIDGHKTEGEERQIDAINRFSGKLAECYFNENGEIKTINSVCETQTEGMLGNSVGTNNAAPQRMKYKSQPKVFYSKDGAGTVLIDANTKILFVPHTDIEDSVGNIEDYFYSGTVSSFYNDNYYYVNSYSVGISDVAADVLVCFDKNESQISANSNYIVVESVCNAINTDGDTVAQFTGYSKKTRVTYQSAEENFRTISGDIQLGTGDVIMVSLDKNKCVREVKMLYDNSEEYKNVTLEYSSVYRCLRGSVYSVDQSSFFMVKNKWDISDSDIVPANLEPHIITSAVAVLVCDVKNREMHVGSIADLVGYVNDSSGYSKVVVGHTSASPNIVVIYK